MTRMFTTILENEIYKNTSQTIFLLVILSILAAISYFILAPRHKTAKEKGKLRVRLIYISVVTFAVFSTKIWVQGFTHIFYGLSLVSAGLVVTNKETIMNLVGWGIISWRGLFIEGDYIEVAGHSGYVYELGVLYFKILEASSIIANRSSGKVVKVPNGLIINTPIKTYTPKSHWLEQKLELYLPIDTNQKRITAEVKEALDAVLDSHYPNLRYADRLEKKGAEMIKDLIYNDSMVYCVNTLEKPEFIKLRASYYCKACDVDTLSSQCHQAVQRIYAKYLTNTKTSTATLLA